MRLFLILIFMLALSGIANAQATSDQVVLGYLAIVNGQAVWLPYTIANPLPTKSN